MAKVIDIINAMEHTNIVTFDMINGDFGMNEITYNGEKFFARPFSCYNWEIVLNGEKVCINPLNYNGELPTIDYPMNWDTMESCNLWLLFNFDKAIIYEAITGEFLGEISEILDSRNIAERIRDMQEAGEI